MSAREGLPGVECVRKDGRVGASFDALVGSDVSLAKVVHAPGNQKWSEGHLFNII